MAVAAGGTTAGVTPTLSLTMTYDGTPITQVKGPDGNTGDSPAPGTTPGPLNPGMQLFLHLTPSGGTAPYSYNVFTDNDPSGKLGAAVVGGSPDTYELTWAGMILNEGESIRVTATVTDNVGAHTSRVDTYAIKRVE